MARPLKDNADWYAHHAQMRNNRKVKALRARFGLEGYAVWNLLLECLTEADKFVMAWGEIDQELIAGDFGLAVERLAEIVAYCHRLGLLSIEGGQIFSKNHQDGMKPLLDVRERKRQWKLAKKPKSDGENRVSDGENAHSTGTDTGTDTGRVHNTLSGISSAHMPPPQKSEIEKTETRFDTLPQAVQAVQAWSQTPQGQIQIEALRSAAMYSPEKYQDGSIPHQISGFIAHYWKNPAHQAQIKQDPIAYTIQNFCAWLSNAKRLNKPIEANYSHKQPPTSSPPPPRRDNTPQYHRTEEQVLQMVQQFAPLLADQFTPAHILAVREKVGYRTATDLITSIAKTLSPEFQRSSHAPVFTTIAPTA